MELPNSDVVQNHALRNSILEHFQQNDRQLSPLKPLTPQASVDEQAAAAEGDEEEEEEPVDPETERSMLEAEQQLQSLDEYVSANAVGRAAVDPLIAQMFRELDADGSGQLNQTELWQLARKLGSTMDESDVEVAMNEMDPDGSGQVDLAEFAAWWSKELEPEPEQIGGGLVGAGGSFVGELPFSGALDITQGSYNSVNSDGGESSARSVGSAGGASSAGSSPNTATSGAASRMLLLSQMADDLVKDSVTKVRTHAIPSTN